MIKKNLLKGHKIREDDITCKRPGTGISPLYWDNIVGSRIKKTLYEDDLLQWEYIDK